MSAISPTGIPFIDGLGNPVGVGARFIYPTRHGSSSAEFTRGIIEIIDPILLDANGDPFKYESQKTPRYGNDYALNYPRRWQPNPASARDYWVVEPGWLYRIKFKACNRNWMVPHDARLSTKFDVSQIVVVEALI